jgi:hypothetical protein
MSDELETEHLADVVWRVMERHARGAVLRFLAAAPCYTLNAGILRDLLDALGLGLSHYRLDRVLAWLQEQQLVGIERGDATVVIVTARGADVAEDRARHDGIARPSPKFGARPEAVRTDEEDGHANGRFRSIT